MKKRAKDKPTPLPYGQTATSFLVPIETHEDMKRLQVIRSEVEHKPVKLKDLYREATDQYVKRNRGLLKKWRGNEFTSTNGAD